MSFLRDQYVSRLVQPFNKPPEKNSRGGGDSEGRTILEPV